MVGRVARVRSFVAAAVVVGVVAACGADDDGATVDVIRSEESGLDDAFAQTATAAGSAYRVSSSVGQELRSSALGIDETTEIDPDRPATVVEVAANGDTHTTIDVGPILGPFASGNPALAEQLDDVRVELWTTSDELIIDSTRYQVIADAVPGYDLGPFAPGLGVVDLTAAGELAGDDIAEALVGTGVADPTTIAEELPAALDGVEQSATDPAVYSGTADFAAVSAALGGDVETDAAAAALGVAQAVGVEVDELAAFYVEVFSELVSEITIVIGDDGAVASIRQVTDLSLIYDRLFAPDSGLSLPFSDAELAQADELFADTVFRQDVLTTFEFDDTIVVVPPTGDLEDRTAIAVEYFERLGH